MHCHIRKLESWMGINELIYICMFKYYITTDALYIDSSSRKRLGIKIRSVRTNIILTWPSIN